MSKPLSQQIGNFLYRNIFPVYNIIYPIFKNRQDADEIGFIKKSLNPGATILDIGANIGFYTKILSQCAGPEGKVHSFEPDTTNFRHLKNNTGHLKNVVLNRKAVSSVTEIIKIYKSKDLNVDHRTYPVGEYESVESIEAVSIDDYFSMEQKVDLIKMDIQGFEVSALKGMVRTVAQNKDIIMVLELWPYGLHAAESSVQAFYDQTLSMGLSISFLEKGIQSPFDLAQIQNYEKWDITQYKNIILKHFGSH